MVWARQIDMVDIAKPYRLSIMDTIKPSYCEGTY